MLKLITEILGGRVASPTASFQDKEGGFNSELFKAEHLSIDDEGSTTDMRVRVRMGSHWKRTVGNEHHKCHAKGKEPLTLHPLWAFTVSCNDEPDKLLAIPPMTSDIVGKVCLLKCSSPEEAFSTDTGAEHALLWEKLTSEIPAFLYYLENLRVDEGEVGPLSKLDRDEKSSFGFVAHRSLEVLDALDRETHESKLLLLIDRVIFRDYSKKEVLLQSVDLEMTLTSDQTFGASARKLLWWDGACGVLLGKLKDKGRVELKRTNSLRQWRILRAEDEVRS